MSRRAIHFLRFLISPGKFFRGSVQPTRVDSEFQSVLIERDKVSGWKKSNVNDLPPRRSLAKDHTLIHDAGMRRSLFGLKVARAIPSQPRRSIIQIRPKCHRELASSTSALAESDTLTLPQERLPFRFETGHALFAKRAPRAFPPPFLSPPSGSFSDPLSTHDRSRDRRARVNGDVVRGYTNGDDAVYMSDMFIAANDGVGAWSTRPGGHAGLVFAISFPRIRTKSPAYGRG